MSATTDQAPWARIPWGDTTVFPVDRNKRPLCKWRDLPKDHVAPMGLAEAYGVATGGGLFVVDIDTGHVDGFESLEGLPADLPPTFAVATPSGGLHLYYRGENARTGTHVLGPGIDVRGEGGYVVGPGSVTEGGVYEIAEDLPIADAPDWLLSVVRRVRSTCLGPPQPTQPTSYTLADLASLAAGRRGHQWDALRRAAKGERLCRVRGGTKGVYVGPVDDFLTRMMAALASQWPDASGDQIVEMLRPSIEILKRDDEEHGNPVYTDENLARKFDSAAAKVRSAAAATKALTDALARAHEATVENGPAVLQYGRSYYVRRNEDWLGPFVGQELVGQLQAEGYAVSVPTRDGTRRMRPEEAVETYGLGGALLDVIYSLSAKRSKHDRVRRTLTIASAPLADVEPRDDPKVHRWLELLGGDPLFDWIAVVKDLDHAAPALWLSGAPQTGKSLLVRGISQLWRAGKPMEISRALSRFNSGSAETPIVFGDEEIPRDGRGRPDLEALKRLITDTERTVERKHAEVARLIGAHRVVLASNNDQMIRGAHNITADDAEALASRIIHLHVPEGGRAREIRELFRSVEPSVQEAWIHRRRIARHLAWIIEHRPSPAYGPRLRLPPHSQGLREALVVQPGGGFYVARALHDWIIRAAQSEESRSAVPGIYVIGSELLVMSSAVSRLLLTVQDREKPSDRQISTILRRMSTGRKQVRTPEPRRCWVVDVANIVAWAETSGWGDIDALTSAWEMLCKTNETGISTR